MPRSRRFRELEGRISELRNHLLPKTFDPTGTYSDRVYDRARGFRVLAHAEIESCVEDLGIDTVNAAYEAWKLDRKPRSALIALLAYSQRNLGGPPAGLGQGGAGPLRDRMKTVRDDYVRYVKIDNNGIKEANVLAVLLPAGILESDLDPAWLSTIDSFGARRGDTAHGTGGTQQPPDPAQELNTVRSILSGLARLDEKLAHLRAQ